MDSLRTQNSKYELILIDNNKQSFHSAAEALNYGGKKAAGKYILFAHQDINVLAPNFLEQVESTLDSLPNIAIAGFAGVSEYGKTNKERQRNIIIEHEHPQTIWGNFIPKPETVQTVDECLFIIPKTIFNNYIFDEITCDNWHFYAVDYCLTMKRMNYDVFVLPIKIHHQSLGFSLKLTIKLKSYKFFKSYYASLKKLIKKHQLHYKYIYTTNGDYLTSKNIYLQDLKRLNKKLLESFMK